MDLVEYSIKDSSLGNLLLMARNGRVIRLDILTEKPDLIRKNVKKAYPDGIFTEKPFLDTWKDLDYYLRGKKVEFHAEIDISDLRPFTQNVLKELLKIPYGELRSYGWIGRQLGYHNASRAVGQAVGRNPLPIIIPCHRVIRENGTIGGFSSGVNIKKRLLAIEGSIERVIV